MIILDLTVLDSLLLKVPSQLSEDGYISETETKTYYNEKKEITGSEVIERKSSPTAEINSARYEVILNLYQTIMQYLDGLDETEMVGEFEQIIEKAPINVQCAYDTLDDYKLIRLSE